VEHVHTHISSICFTPANLNCFVRAMAAIWIIFLLLPKVAITKLHCSQAITRYSQDGMWTGLCQLNVLSKTKCTGRKNLALWQPNNMSGNDPFGLYSFLPHFKSITHIPKISVRATDGVSSSCALHHLCLKSYHVGAVVELCHRDINMFVHVNGYWRCDWYDWCT